MSWEKVLEAHTVVVTKIYPAEKVALLAGESGLKINANGSNSARSEADIERYLRAVEKVLGSVALMSAKLKISGKKRILGL